MGDLKLIASDDVNLKRNSQLKKQTNQAITQTNQTLANKSIDKH